MIAWKMGIALLRRMDIREKKVGRTSIFANFLDRGTAMSPWSVCQSPPISDTLRLGLDGDQVVASGTLMRGTDVITNLEEGLYIAQHN